MTTFNSITSSSVDNVEQIVYENTLTGDAASVTISGLDGNTDEEYRLIIFGAPHTTDSAHWVSLYLNNDSSINNYTITYTFYTSSAGGAIIGTGSSAAYATYINAGNQPGFSDIRIFAKSGRKRSIIGRMNYGLAASQFPWTFNFTNQWTNTADNLTSIVLSGNMGAGTYICLMKRTQNTTGKLFNTMTTKSLNANCFTAVYDSGLLNTTSPVTITGLNGNVDKIYDIEIRHHGDSATLNLNADTGANYAYSSQYGKWSGGVNSFTGEGFTGGSAMILTYGTAATTVNRCCYGSIYAATGRVRCGAIDYFEVDGNDGTPAYAGTFATMWTNTADNITSITFNGGFQTSSTIRLKTIKRV